MLRLSIAGTALLFLVVACGARSTNTPSTATVVALTSSTAAVMTARTVPPVVTTTTAAPRSSTTSAVSGLNILRIDGVADVDFGTPMDAALARFEEILGPPDRIETEGTNECYWSVEELRLAYWDSEGLRLVFTDWDGDTEQPSPAPMHLSDWEVVGPGVTTDLGLGWGSSTEELKTIYSQAMFGIDELAPTFFLEFPQGWMIGALDWNFADYEAAVHTALAEHGVASVPEFMDSQGMDDALDVLTALGLPPGDIPIGWIHAGAGPLCD